MSETIPQAAEQARQLTEVELMQLGEACMRAADIPGLETVVSEHTELLENPNSAGAGLFVGGEVPMNSDSAYRQVGVEAINDLAQSGIVRNGATARGEPHRRWGHKVFWNEGKDGTKIATGGRFVIEAPLQAVKEGWVTADKVTGIYTKTPEGEVKNILELH